MPAVTIATFNCENLFQRFMFNKKLTKSRIDQAVQNGFILDKKLFLRVTDKERKLTANAINDTGADIIGLQEVENLDTLKGFQSQFVRSYPYQYLIDGNDPRLIDVGVLSKYEAKCLKTHQFDKTGTKRIFSRDCLEIEFNIEGTALTLFVNHFKSMIGGRNQTMAKRKEQAERVRQIITDKFGDDPSNKNFIVLGDMNDYLPSEGLEPLISRPWLENVLERLPEQDRWTHWYDKDNSVAQLDYLLVSKGIASNNQNTLPVVIRKGLAKNANRYTGPRYAGVGATRPSASDHCPVAITLNI